MTKPTYLADLNDFALKIGLPKFVLTRFIFQSESYYKVFRLKKSSGRGYRKIAAPSRELKGIQKWISTFILRQVELPDEATGFRSGMSIKNNAEPHLNKDFVCNIDIEDFFPSVSAKRVTAIFKSLGFPKVVAGSLSRLTTFKGTLPQGAPSSPDLANIVLRRLDARIAGFCKKRRWSYTRYCDDITISGSGGVSKKELETLAEIIYSEGFLVNDSKTRTRRRNSRQEVTGLVVNKHINLSRQRRKSMRAMFHQAFLFPERFRARLSELEGHLSYFKFLRPSDTAAHERYKVALDRVKSLS